MARAEQMSSNSSVAIPTRSSGSDLGQDCWVELHRDFVVQDHALRMRALLETLPWVQEVYPRGGRFQPAPRLTSFHGDAGCAYTYAGIAYQSEPWMPELEVLRARCEARTEVAFNCVLCNLYRDGRDSVGWHADDEPELGPHDDDIAIASVSLGAPRRFVLKHRRDGRRLAFDLGEGSLLLRGRTQRLWLHALPKTQAPCGPRLNLTFRVVRQPACHGFPRRRATRGSLGTRCAPRSRAGSRPRLAWRRGLLAVLKCHRGSARGSRAQTRHTASRRRP